MTSKHFLSLYRRAVQDCERCGAALLRCLKAELLSLYKRELDESPYFVRVYHGGKRGVKAAIVPLGFAVKDGDGDKFTHISKYGLHDGDVHLLFAVSNVELLYRVLRSAKRRKGRSPILGK